jgi:hypothetical protein
LGLADWLPFPAIHIVAFGAIQTDMLPAVFDRISELTRADVVEFTIITAGDELKFVVL